MRRLTVLTILVLCGSLTVQADELIVSRADYLEKLHGFWLGQCIANWTGIITEMDKIGVLDMHFISTAEGWAVEGSHYQ